ncbi:hypothetical protein E1193_24525 [Micromonospora sp. KC606]|uniref:hypothetical protein n=1 Tax=Micromonospora sp. KC606 TaxID=2530379 RepID=UPI00104B9B26|nr:hypothetical protein [Micromonospora sp. KC606]TDC76036.1 hypothetical protein E1193_24525 [Micromonospora sp. KC606]
MTSETARRLRAGRRTWLAIGVVLLLAVLIAPLAGLSPVLPVFLALLGAVSVRPVPGLSYVALVLTVPLGLWFVGLERLVGDAFGGREYALSISASLVVGVLFVLTVARGHWHRWHVAAAAVAVVVLGVWSLIGIAHHGVAQTLVGVRLMVVPLLLLVVLAALPGDRLAALVTVMSWLLVANAVASLAELAVGPARLVQWGFEEGRAVRYIGETFRVPGLTEFNGELGILAGAYLLGYLALWLTPGARPTRWSWHAGGVAALLCLALSTSRSGALLVAAGVVAAVVVNRSGGVAARRRARLFGLAVVACLVGAFVAVGATGARSLFDRFEVWSALLSDDLPPWGRGVGSVGAATSSRIASGQQIFVDNYFVSLALQFGPVLTVAVVAALGWALWRLWRLGAEDQKAVPLTAILVGLACASLMIEAWEYPGAMMCLGLFVAYARRPAPARPARVLPPAPRIAAPVLPPPPSIPAPAAPAPVGPTPDEQPGR